MLKHNDPSWGKHNSISYLFAVFNVLLCPARLIVSCELGANYDKKKSWDCWYNVLICHSGQTQGTPPFNVFCLALITLYNYDCYCVKVLYFCLMHHVCARIRALLLSSFWFFLVIKFDESYDFSHAGDALRYVMPIRFSSHFWYSSISSWRYYIYYLELMYQMAIRIKCPPCQNF